MKRITLILSVLCAMASTAMAQKPLYLPGDGVYIMGIPADQTNKPTYPVMVAEAYKATFKTKDVQLAAITADKVYNVTENIEADGTLNLIKFMGIGQADNLIVRTFTGQSYMIGDNAPEKTWNKVSLIAAYPNWNQTSNQTLGVYDHWDCPISYEVDEMITVKKMDAITVDFGNPHEGLVVDNINFNLVSNAEDLNGKLNSLKVTLTLWNEDHNDVAEQKEFSISDATVKKVQDLGNGLYLHSVYVKYNTVINTTFDICISGLTELEATVWLPRAIDTHDLYPTHTTYSKGEEKESLDAVDACINIDGYFNYIGAYGWYDGKHSFGEVVGQGDYVQYYIDPSDPDWEGAFFTGEPTFPIESTFGKTNIDWSYKPSWISKVDIDESQWTQYGALLIILTADGLPIEETGRVGCVTFTTKDGASSYSVFIRQGDAALPDPAGITTITLPKEGGMFDLSGRMITTPAKGSIFILNGKKYYNK